MKSSRKAIQALTLTLALSSSVLAGEIQYPKDAPPPPPPNGIVMQPVTTDGEIQIPLTSKGEIQTGEADTLTGFALSLLQGFLSLV